MMKTIMIIMFMLISLMGISGAVVELSGTDPMVFDQVGMQKDGIGTTMLGAEIWGVPIGWNNAGDGAGFGNVTPLLTGSLAKAAYMENKEKVELLNTSEQFEAYINKTINGTAGEV